MHILGVDTHGMRGRSLLLCRHWTTSSGRSRSNLCESLRGARGHVRHPGRRGVRSTVFCDCFRLVGKPHLTPLSSNRTSSGTEPQLRHRTPPAWMRLCTPFSDRNFALGGRITLYWVAELIAFSSSQSSFVICLVPSPGTTSSGMSQSVERRYKGRKSLRRTFHVFQ
jgi:hypothetical protein